MISPPEGSMELAQARLSARFGSMADEVLWSRIRSTLDFRALLEVLRGSPLSRWVQGILPDDGLHAIEAALRGHWRAEVDDVVAWMPRPWQPAVLWCRTWLDRPMLHYLANGEPAPLWLSIDPAFRDAAQRNDAPRKVQRVVPHYPATNDCWVAFRQYVPDVDACGLAELMRMLRQAEAHAWRSEGSMPARKWLRNALVMLFRRTMVEPVAAFSYLAITAIDVERLRGELVCSAIFGPLGVAAQT